MKTTIEVTNEKLFDLTVADVNTDYLKSTDDYNGTGTFAAQGHLTIELANGEWMEAQGEFGERDYEEEYGFILKTME